MRSFRMSSLLGRRFRMSSLLGRRFQVDFVQDRPPTPPLSWLLLGAGVVTLCAAFADFVPRWLEHARVIHEIEALQAWLDRLAGMARTGLRAADGEGSAQAHGVLGDLGRPWPALFDQFEAAATQDVHLVQFAVDARFRTMQLMAEASTLERVLQYSQQLPGKGPVRAVRLTHHEWRDTPSGRIVVADLTADLTADLAPEAAAAAGPLPSGAAQPDRGGR